MWRFALPLAIEQPGPLLQQASLGFPKPPSFRGPAVLEDVFAGQKA
jgi:hypothetical protein